MDLKFDWDEAKNLKNIEQILAAIPNALASGQGRLTDYWRNGRRK